jgi:hypothetical protein
MGWGIGGLIFALINDERKEVNELRGLIMATKRELESALEEQKLELEALGATVATEAVQVNTKIGQLEGMILQLQNAPSEPVDFAPVLAEVKASTARLKEIGEAVAGIVADEVVEAPIVEAPVEEVEVPELPVDEEVEEDEEDEIEEVLE